MPPKILLIDDEASIGPMLGLYLAKKGLTLSWERTGEGGLTLLNEGRFDVILLDLGLPDLDGLEVLQCVNTKRPTVPVIVITGLGGSDDRSVEALRQGAAGLVCKPFHLATLYQEICRVLRWVPV